MALERPYVGAVTNVPNVNDGVLARSPASQQLFRLYLAKCVYLLCVSDQLLDTHSFLVVPDLYRGVIAGSGNELAADFDCV